MKSSSQARARAANVLGILILAGSLWAVLPPVVAFAQVGHNGLDYAAQIPGSMGGGGGIRSATGSFLSVSGASSVVTCPPADVNCISGNYPNNVFELEIDTNKFYYNPPACPTFCYGWQQFIFSQTQGPAPTAGQQSVVPGTTPILFIKYWLLDVDSCPTTQPLPGFNWASDGYGDCWFNGPSTYVPPQTVADLASLVMTASATAAQDEVSLQTTSGTFSAVGTPSVLALNNYWNTAEFNVYGDCCSSVAKFSTPTTLIVKTAIDDGTGMQPKCQPSALSSEANSLFLAPAVPQVFTGCCPYGGLSPAIEILESTDPNHKAHCGPTRLEGDPHITTVDGSHYDFQSAGEFVALHDPDGQDIQTRQEAAATTFIGTDGYDGLTTCVSVNTAVAARVGKHRVTYEPNLSGVPDPSGLQLRIDGALTALSAPGIALGSGGRVAPSGGGGLEVDFPDGKTLLVTPAWWASQAKWYLNVDVSHGRLVGGASADAGRGLAGALPEGSWLPALPNGASMGPMPATLPERYTALYRTFADAWRVSDRDSLFDYAPGTSTATFTRRDWPKQTLPCEVPETKPTEPASEAVAEGACRRVTDPDRHADCVFDVRVTGNLGFAKTYLATQRIFADATTTTLTDSADPSLAGEWVTFTAYVAASATPGADVPSGTVQFAVDGTNAGAPVTVDAKGRATFETSHLRVGANRVTAAYLPGKDSAFLSSESLAKIHEVKRCRCEAAPEREQK